MKKHIFCLFWIIVGPFALAQNVEVGGEVNLQFSAWQLPTGQRGVTEFEISTLFFDVDALLANDNVFHMRFENRDQSLLSATGEGDRFVIGVREAYLDLLNFLPGFRALRLGLVPQPWQEAQYQIWGYRFLGRTGWGITEKWGYLNYSDFGATYMSRLPSNWGEFAFTFTNGEGVQNPGEAHQKEAALFFKFFAGQPFSLSLNYVYGRYDLYGEDVNRKERAQALLAYEGETWKWGAEFLWSQDPGNALEDLRMAEGVDVTDVLDQVVSGQGASVFVVYNINEHSDFMTRIDYLNAATKLDGRTLQTLLMAYGYQYSESVKFALAGDYTKYDENYGVGVRDSSKLSLSVQVLF